jgi:aryl-alcohol dehydrogenase-like predicted oxidoreductase
MEMNTLGKTGLRVSRLGAGLAEMGHLSLDQEAIASELLNAALDGGINFLDTAACYGNSEELIGRTIAHRRDEYILATKAGHVTGGYDGQPWTASTIQDSIERSLKRMKTDHLDLVQLHSCGVETLEQGEVIQALLDARQAGKTRFVGYSGDNEAAVWAVKSGHFDTLQTSFNLLDQTPRKELLPLAKEQGLGVIIKRPIANAVWAAPSASSRVTYRERAEEIQSEGEIPGAPGDPIALAIGFTLAHDEVDTAIVGTSDPGHMKANIKLVEWQLPLPDETIEELHRRFDQMSR